MVLVFGHVNKASEGDKMIDYLNLGTTENQVYNATSIW